MKITERRLKKLLSHCCDFSQEEKAMIDLGRVSKETKGFPAVVPFELGGTFKPPGA